jgi:hypothetical protein
MYPYARNANMELEADFSFIHFFLMCAEHVKQHMTYKQEIVLKSCKLRYFALPVCHGLNSGALRKADGKQDEFFSVRSSNIREDHMSVSFMCFHLWSDVAPKHVLFTGRSDSSYDITDKLTVRMCVSVSGVGT